MKVLCNHCGKAVLPLANFCSWCGEEAPRKTVILKGGEELTFQNPAFCPSCGKEAPRNALYCAHCGTFIYQLPKKDTFFCPNCKEKNNAVAKVCASCGISFSDWFSMRGPVAEFLGYKGNITLKETMNDIYYHFLSDKQIRLGRNMDNNIVIPSFWVSGQHCMLDNTRKLLVDLKSTNGTFVNRNGKRIKSFSMSSVFEFNIAGSFTFTVTSLINAFAFRLTAILNQNEVQKFSDIQSLDELRKHYFILLSGDAEIIIYKIDGIIEKQSDNNQEIYKIQVLNNFYYFSDFARNINNRLILKDFNNMPVNWEIIDNRSLLTK